ncbi:hypothetical protein H5410_062781 [Solanum commersonii]|uniref:Uncharacterized protein n=1 Tax=Solanum commersonii TaxID=4109 RepID=A0A9J5WCH1_SOLCO|nr:hypothetical protein H5410_062781 [Solanum commersonii]
MVCEKDEEDDLYKIYEQFKELSLNVIDNDKVIELTQTIKDPKLELKSLIKSVIPRKRIRFEKDHILKTSNQKGSYTMAEEENDKLPTTISDLKEEINNLKDDITRLKEKNVVIENPKLQEKIAILKNQFSIDICGDHPNAFWNRKKHVISLPYEDNFIKDNISTKARPCQMNADYLELCKKKIDSLLQKGLIRHSKSL